MHPRVGARAGPLEFDVLGKEPGIAVVKASLMSPPTSGVMLMRLAEYENWTSLTAEEPIVVVSFIAACFEGCCQLLSTVGKASSPHRPALKRMGAGLDQWSCV